MEQDIKAKPDEEKKEVPTPKDAGEGVQPKTKTKIDLANEAAERTEKATVEATKVADRLDEHKADVILSGEAEAGAQPVKKPKMTDQEYAQALSEGKVNPLKDDGHFC